MLKVMNEVIALVQKKKKRHTLQLAEDLYWDSDALLLYENGNEILLSKNENIFISLLYNNKNIIFSLEELAYQVDETKLLSPQAIKNLINRLRKKISVDFIHNHYGVGYQLRH